ncbi:MAG TPA: hypothetical protein DCL21_05560 [Alphaproteobacteria bacterium]|nr:hypothetical protein [Alphaproteobacteria bacterium]
MDTKVKELRDNIDSSMVLGWFARFDNDPDILANIAYKSLVLKHTSCSIIEFNDMPLCSISREYTEEALSELLYNILNTLGDEIVKNIILKYGPLAFMQENLPSELAVLLDTELVQKSIANYRKATEARQSCSIIIHRCSYGITENSNFEYGYHENYKWWDDTGLQKFNCE